MPSGLNCTSFFYHSARLNSQEEPVYSIELDGTWDVKCQPQCGAGFGGFWLFWASLLSLLILSEVCRVLCPGHLVISDARVGALFVWNLGLPWLGRTCSLLPPAHPGPSRPSRPPSTFCVLVWGFLPDLGGGFSLGNALSSFAQGFWGRLLRHDPPKALSYWFFGSWEAPRQHHTLN